MKNLILILALFLSINLFSQTQGEIWINLSEILSRNQIELRTILKEQNICYGASENYIMWKDSIGQKYQVFFADNRVERLEVENIRFSINLYKVLLTETDYFVPVYGRFYYKSYLTGTKLVLVEE